VDAVVEGAEVTTAPVVAESETKGKSEEE
jgi:hypothetical protein